MNNLEADLKKMQASATQAKATADHMQVEAPKEAKLPESVEQKISEKAKE